MRLAALLTLILAPSVLAADFPQDMTPDARAAFLKKWQTAYATERDKWTAQADEARSLLKFKATEKEGKAKLAEATAALASLEKEPGLFVGSPAQNAGEKEPLVGEVCNLRVVNNEFAVAETIDGRTLVECVIPRNGKAAVTRYLIASPIDVPKKKDGKIGLPGMWYCAGTTEVKGKTVPVLYRLELKKDDYPPAKK